MNTKNKKEKYYLTEIKSRKTNPWRLIIQVNNDRKILYFKTKALAEKERAKLKSIQYRHFKSKDAEYFSLPYLFEKWVRYREGNIASSTLYNYKKTFYSVFRDFTDSWFHEIERGDLLENLKNGNSPVSAIRMALTMLKFVNEYSLSIFRYGVDWNIDEMRKLFKPERGKRRKHREFHNKEEIQLISSYLKNNDIVFYHIYRLGLLTGCRIGELCALQKANYDRVNKSLLINSSITVKDGVIIHGTSTKTKSSRYVSLSEKACMSVEYLILISESKFIIPNRKKRNKFLAPIVINNVMKKVFQDIGVLELSSHQFFRKTFATQIAQVSAKSFTDMVATIQKQLGHRSAQMTMHYIQSLENDIEDEVNKLDDFLDD